MLSQEWEVLKSQLPSGAGINKEVDIHESRIQG